MPSMVEARGRELFRLPTNDKNCMSEHVAGTDTDLSIHRTGRLIALIWRCRLCLFYHPKFPGRRAC